VTQGTASHCVFALFSSAFLGDPGNPCRLIVTVRTTTVVPAGAGSIRVRFQYQDFSNQTRAFDSGPLAANFVTAEVEGPPGPAGATQTLMSNVGGEQVLVIPVTGLCCVKGGVLTGPDGEIWDLVLSGQTPVNLWAKVTYRFPPIRITKATTELPPTLSVTLTTEDNLQHVCRAFFAEIFHVPDDNGG